MKQLESGLVAKKLSKNESTLLTQIQMIISVCVMALLFFDKAFVLFHQVFFDNDDWMFDYRTDPIISFLPETFFFLCFLLIVTISVSTLTTIHHLFNKEERTL